MAGVKIRTLGTMAVAAMGASLPACIGVHGQKPEVANMQIAEEERQADSDPIEESLGGKQLSARVEIDVAAPRQTLEGFGAAVAWYQDRIIGSTPEDLYEFLFPELGLDILRYRNRFQREGEEDSNLAAEIEIYQRATQALGYAPLLMLTSWSPPASLKMSGKEKCRGEKECTLAKKNGKFVYDEFADWWLRSLKHYHSKGLTPHYVSMQNEPSFIPPDWEGCKFEPEETAEYPGYDKALEKFAGRLAELDFAPKVLGPETLGIHYDRTQKFLAALDESLLYGVAHHLYEMGNDGVWDWRDPGPESYVDEMRAIAALTKKPIFQTEFNTDDDKGIDGGFETAWLIHATMVDEGAAAFIYWDLIWPEKGLVSMRGKTPTPRDQYYALRHFARFTDPGYVRVDTRSDQSGLLASAYLSPKKDRITLVVLNTTEGVIDVALDSGEFSADESQAFRTIFRPGKSKRWEELGSLPENAGVSLPARSMATVVFDRKG